jgi:hypothetical protein
VDPEIHTPEVAREDRTWLSKAWRRVILDDEFWTPMVTAVFTMIAVGGLDVLVANHTTADVLWHSISAGVIAGIMKAIWPHRRQRETS